MIGISGISFLRTVLPDKDFIDRSFEDQNVKILNRKSQNPDVRKLIGWLLGANEALDRKYVSLKALIFLIFHSKLINFFFKKLKSMTLSIYENMNAPEVIFH